VEEIIRGTLVVVVVFPQRIFFLVAAQKRAWRVYKRFASDGGPARSSLGNLSEIAFHTVVCVCVGGETDARDGKFNNEEAIGRMD
jgi:hypothetical protein